MPLIKTPHNSINLQLFFIVKIIRLLKAAAFTIILCDGQDMKEVTSGSKIRLNCLKNC